MNLTTSNDDDFCTISHPPDDGYDGTDMASKETLRTFKTYCDKPYDRHIYKMYSKEGKCLTYDNYEIMRYHWYQMKDEVSHVEVVDVPKKRGGGKGF